MLIGDCLSKLRGFLVDSRSSRFRRRGRAAVQSEILETRVLLAAVVELVQDFETAPSNSILTMPVMMNGASYFAAIDTLHGQELWTSDGTADGTVRITDIVPGPGSTEISELTVVGDTLYFRATDRSHHGQLWQTDGTAAGTHQLRLGTSGGSIDAHSLTAWNDQLAFATSNNDQAFICSSDGTDAGTRSLVSVPGVDQIVSTSNGTLYFVTMSPPQMETPTVLRYGNQMERWTEPELSRRTLALMITCRSSCLQLMNESIGSTSLRGLSRVQPTMSCGR